VGRGAPALRLALRVHSRTLAQPRAAAHARLTVRRARPARKRYRPVAYERRRPSVAPLANGSSDE
jgi:hypothetical protein